MLRFTRPARPRVKESAIRRIRSIKAFSGSGTTKHYIECEIQRLNSYQNLSYTGAMHRLAAFLMLFASALLGQARQPAGPRIVEFASRSLHLKGYLWKPSGAGSFAAVLFNHGSGGPDAMQTGGMTMEEAAATLAPVFVKHGYAFFYPCRRGHGLSAGQGRFIQDELKDEETARGVEARQKLQFRLMTGPQLEDTLAALSFLRTVPGIDAGRVAVIGHSFGGQLTLLDVERDGKLRAAVTFGAAANSWAQSPELRDRLLGAMDKASVPIMLIHASNDYDTSAGRELAKEPERLHKTYLLKIYPPVGKTSDEGHDLVYNSIPVWEADVFRFLDENVRR
jgi:dienelactone hydrolase